MAAPQKLEWFEAVRAWLSTDPKGRPHPFPTCFTVLAAILEATTSSNGEVLLSARWVEREYKVNRTRAGEVIAFLIETGWLEDTGQVRDRVPVYLILNGDTGVSKSAQVETEVETEVDTRVSYTPDSRTPVDRGFSDPGESQLSKSGKKNMTGHDLDSWTSNTLWDAWVERLAGIGKVKPDGSGGVKGRCPLGCQGGESFHLSRDGDAILCHCFEAHGRCGVEVARLWSLPLFATTPPDGRRRRSGTSRYPSGTDHTSRATAGAATETKTDPSPTRNDPSTCRHRALDTEGYCAGCSTQVREAMV